MGKVKSDEFVPSSDDDDDSNTGTESDEPKKKERKAVKISPDKKPKKERRPLSEDEEEEEEEVKKPVAKKSKKEESTKKMVTTKDGQVYWELTKNRRVALSEFKGRMYVGIREYYEKNGELLPGKKGISLPIEQWKKLSKLSKEINEHIEEEGY